MGFQARKDHSEFFRLVYSDYTGTIDPNLADFDNDGFTNLEEAIADTDPYDAQSFPANGGNGDGGSSSGSGSSGSGTTSNYPWEYKLTYVVDGYPVEDFINPDDQVESYSYDFSGDATTEIRFENIIGVNQVKFLQVEPNLDYDSSDPNSERWNVTGVIELSAGNPYWGFEALGALGDSLPDGFLLPIDIVAHKRGTIDAPGAEQPKGNGEYGYETVMMENADSEDNNTGKRDCDTAAVDKAKDDDFVKIVLHYPGPQIEGASLELKHEGIAVDAKVKGSEMEDPEAAIEVLDTGSRLNFYDKDGNKLNPATDLKIGDLKNPGSGYLAKIFDPVNNGKLTLFIEGADKFGLVGYKDEDLEKLGGSRLKWIFKQGDQKAEIPVLVYRGGFLVFKQPEGKPGVAANFEFWDGKGRIRHEFGGFGDEFKEDDTDFGKKIATWVAKSGKPVKPSSPRPYNVRNKSGHLPPGWYWEQSATVAPSEKDRWKNGVLHQGSYVRWKEDNTGGYKNDFEYDPAHDSQVGKPTAMSFKYQLDPIRNWVKDPSRNNYKSYLDRTRCQVHPDGKQDGSGGCISIQTWDDCRDVLYVLKNYNALEVKVQLEE